MKYRILIAEDDLNLGFLLVEYLEENNFEVKLCKDGESALKAYGEGEFAICILDVMMPKLDGFSLAQEIKKQNKTQPIIFLTARSVKEDKIKGFVVGADDYITKPFDEEELLYRVKALITRTTHDTQEFTIGSIKFDAENHALHLKKEVKRLTLKENQILSLLCEKKNKLVGRDDILEKVWGDTSYFTGRSLDVFITKLRKYLQEDKNISLESIPRAGFILSDK